MYDVKMSSKALTEIHLSEPYLALLGSKKTCKLLKRIIIQEAPKELFSVLTQISRHILNKTFCVKNKRFCEKSSNSLYLLALPSSDRKTKEKVLLSESTEFYNQILQLLKAALEE